MRIQFLTFLLLGLAFGGNAQTKPADSAHPYAVSNIPKTLLTQQANVVFREYYETTNLTNPSKSVNSVRLVATILREDGKKWARCYVHYSDKNQKIVNFSGNLYDAQGKFIRKVKASEIQDIAMDDGFSIATDSRAKVTELLYGQYPFTVEFDYKVEGKGTFPVESWTAQPLPSVSVEEATFEMRNCPCRKSRISKRLI